MAANIEQEGFDNESIMETLKGWMMIVVTLVFVILYAAALTGWLKPLADFTMITRLEPIIFVIIGYHFGRLPAQQNEKTLKEEIDRQSRKADAAQHVKEQAQKEREVMEEKIKNAKVALRPDIYEPSGNTSHSSSHISPIGAAHVAAERPGLLNRSVETVRRILDS